MFFWDIYYYSNNLLGQYTALLDIPKNRFDRFKPTFIFFKYHYILNILWKIGNAIKYDFSKSES
jgi:hypothetical protein